MGISNYVIKKKLSETVEEAYNVLRANIFFSDQKQKIKTLALTSYSPNEGKSTTALNLSLSMAKIGMNTLHVDADLRKPMSMKSLFSLNINGLSNYLLGQVEIDEIINESNIEGFSFITCGTKQDNPSELVSSERFSSFLEIVSDQFDAVIIDLPPLSSVIDSAIIASQTDGTIIIIEANAVGKKNAKMMIEQLEKANANILGTVLTKISKTDYRNYYGNYDYYGSKKKKSKKRFRSLLRKRGKT